MAPPQLSRHAEVGPSSTPCTGIPLQTHPAALAAVVDQPQAAELPARRRVEEIAVTRARVAIRGRERGAAQHHLVDHELAVILAERTRGRAESRIGRIRTAR